MFALPLEFLPFVPLFLFVTLLLGAWLFFQGAKPKLGGSLVFLVGCVCFFPATLNLVNVTSIPVLMGQIFVDQSQWVSSMDQPLLRGSVELGWEVSQNLVGSGGLLLWVDLTPALGGSAPVTLPPLSSPSLEVANLLDQVQSQVTT